MVNRIKCEIVLKLYREVDWLIQLITYMVGR